MHPNLDPTFAVQNPSPSGAFSFRSLLIGLLAVIGLSAIAYYNDNVLCNTGVIGNYLPVAPVLIILALVLGVNVLLFVVLPRQMLRREELAVIVSMLLAGSAIPSSGLMRYLPPLLAGIPGEAANSSDVARVLDSLHVPTWVFPNLAGESWHERGNDDVIRNFIARVPLDRPTFAARLRAVPWHAWLAPAIAWSIFFAALYGATMSLLTIVRRQWAENERLAFPLVSVYAALIEPPPPGRALNALFRSGGFWVAFGIVFAIHVINGLNRFFPAHVPEVPLRFDFNSILADPPLSFIDWYVKRAAIYFSIIGILYFVPSKIGLSVWTFVMLLQVANINLGAATGESVGEGRLVDQQFGAFFVFAAGVIWIGRHHWARVLREMVGRQPSTRDADATPYALAGWFGVACMVVLIGWLWMANASLIGATAAVLMVLTLFLVVARVVAETGLSFVQLSIAPTQPWMILNSLTGLKTTDPSFFLTQLVHGALTRDLRENFATFNLHAMQVVAGGGDPRHASRRSTLALLAALALATGVAFVVGGASTLFVEYSHASTLDQSQRVVNNEATNVVMHDVVVDPTVSYITRGAPATSHNRLGQVGVGASIAATLTVCSLRFAAWPLHPIGYLLVGTYPVRMIWFSVFLGWLVKVLVVRFGGGKLYSALRPVCIGLIIGEVAAAAVWLVVNFLLATAGAEYVSINLLPG